MTARPDFTSIASFGEFSEYYRYRADFCADSDTRAYSPRLKAVAAALRAQVRASRVEKVYSRRLPDENRALLSQYSGENNRARRKK